MLDEIGDILFSVIVGYMGALEFFFIARHLYHWTMRHCQKYDENSLAHIQEQLKSAIAVAAEREKSGYNAMEDGVLYKDEKQITQENKSSDNKKHEIMTHANDSLYPTQTLKTQFSQDPEKDKFSFKSKLPQNISEESIEPQSSKSSLSTQTSNSVDGPMISEELAREDPEGEPTQYPDDYLRSLDGLKNKPLTRDDGTGRRRAFKKRKSSDSSNSSRDSRTSRDEELKMFTSLEEKEQEKHDFVPIHYSEQNLKVKPRRRHKRSPGHDYKRPDSAGSLPIDEEEDYTFDLPTDEEQAREVRQSPFPTSNVHNSSSFEEATKDQHEDILSNMQQKGNSMKLIRRL
uniref:Uncharacterized protein n=1 Tax=Megaselia scalaris TaxID=36166 RepID=T1GA40_MEGSC